MLQKGFLNNKENPDNFRTIKKSRLLLLAGVVLIVGAMIFMMTNLQQTGTFATLGLVVIIIGFCLTSVGLWMNFFAQSKKLNKTGV